MVLATDDPAAAERFAALPSVRAVDRDGPGLLVRGVGDDLVTQVIACLAEHRMSVSDFRTEIPSLEDVFLKLTGRTIRD